MRLLAQALGGRASFGWTARFRRLVRDFERSAATLAGLHFVAFAILMLARFVKSIASVV